MKEGVIALYIRAGAAREASREYLRGAIKRYLSSDERSRREGRNLPELPAGPVSSWRLEKGEHGKPFYQDAPWLHFSISHSGAFWVCAVSGQPLGVDLQERRRKGKAAAKNEPDNLGRIAARFFHPAEAQYFSSMTQDGSRAWEAAFYDIWAAKESYVKYTGEGIGKNFGEFSVSDGKGLCLEVNPSFGPPAMLRFLELEPGYSLCVCAERIEEVRVFDLGLP